MRKAVGDRSENCEHVGDDRRVAEKFGLAEACDDRALLVRVSENPGSEPIEKKPKGSGFRF